MSEKLGGRAYALYSDKCIQAMGIDPVAQGLVQHQETIDIFGDVKVWLRDLEAAWQQENERTRVEVKRADAYVTWDFDIPAPRRVVWEYVTVPGPWQQWWPADEIIEKSDNGRRGVGTKNHCMHGKDAIIEEVLDWRPFDYFTVGISLPVPNAPKIVMTRAVKDASDGASVLEMRVAVPKPEHKDFVDQAGAKFAANMTSAIEKLRQMLEGRQASIAVIDEPLMSSEGRFLSEPVK